MSPETGLEERRILLLAPTGKDSVLISRLLQRAGSAVEVCQDFHVLCDEISRGASAVLVAEEGLPDDAVAALAERLSNQPAWSDLPVIVLTISGKTTRRSANLAKALEGKVNLTFLERPVRMLTLVSAVQAAYRARLRQYEVRKLLMQASEEVVKRDQFIAMLGHELRNPLAAIRTSIEILTRFGCNDPEMLAGQCDVINRQSRNMARLVDDLLDVARITSGRLTLAKSRLDLREVVQGSIQEIQLAMKEQSHPIMASLPSHEVIVEGDPVRLGQIFANLLSNAARYSPSGTRIDVVLESRHDQAVVRVKDQGEGILPELLGTMFEPFVQSNQTLSRTRGGLGLGLAVVRSLVDLHGGSVEAKSRGPGTGSEFIVRLPSSEQESEAIRPDTSPAHIDSCTKSVLIVEDNPDARQTLAKYLRLLNHQVYEAEDGQLGLEKLISIRPDFALVDIGLPKLSGYDVASRARQEIGGSTVMVAVSGYGQTEDRQRALDSGFDHHLVKPIDLTHVSELLAMPEKPSTHSPR